MKYIYEVSIKQYYDYFSSKSLFKKREKLSSDITYIKQRLVLAESEEEAIKLYDKRYYWKDAKLNPYKTLWESDSNFELTKNELVAKKVMKSFEYLKENMRADEFLEYCKQELYPIEVVMR